MKIDLLGRSGAAALGIAVAAGFSRGAHAQEAAAGNVPGAQNAIVYKQAGDATLYVRCGAMGGAVSVVPDGWHRIPAEKLPEYKRNGYLIRGGGKNPGLYLGSEKIVTRAPDGTITRCPLPAATATTAPLAIPRRS